jgi:hypothetical protein
MFTPSFYPEKEINLNLIVSMVNNPEIESLTGFCNTRNAIIDYETDDKPRIIKPLDNGVISVEISDDNQLIQFSGLFRLKHPEDEKNNLKIVNELNINHRVPKFFIADQHFVIEYFLICSIGVTDVHIMGAYVYVSDSISKILKEYPKFLGNLNQ